MKELIHNRDSNEVIYEFPQEDNKEEFTHRFFGRYKEAKGGAGRLLTLNRGARRGVLNLNGEDFGNFVTALDTFFDGSNFELRVSETLNAAPIASGDLNFCVNNSTDGDHDGWGFESNISCVVKCLNPNTQVDEKGWGIENQGGIQQRCNNKYDPTTATSVNTYKGGRPVCQDPSTDEDNDGWGYENNASCVVKCASLTTVTDASGWGTETRNGQSARCVQVIP